MTYNWPDFTKDAKANEQAKRELGLADKNYLTSEQITAIALRAQEIKGRL